MSESTNGSQTGKPGDVVALPAAQAVKPTSAEALRQVLGEESRPFYCSFDPSTPAGRSLLDRCEEAEDGRVKGQINLTLDLVHVYAKPVEFVSKQTGEFIQAVRICLIDKAGKVFGCTAGGVRDSISRLSQQHGLPPWSNGIKVKVLLKDLADGKQRLVLLNVDEPAGKEGKK